jgi:hypothetical protein
MLTYSLIDLRGITLYPSPHSSMIHREATLAHHLFKVAVRELVPAIPADTQKDDSGLEVPPLERGLVLLQEYDSGSKLDELASGL